MKKFPKYYDLIWGKEFGGFRKKFPYFRYGVSFLLNKEMKKIPKYYDLIWGKEFGGFRKNSLIFVPKLFTSPEL